MAYNSSVGCRHSTIFDCYDLDVRCQPVPMVHIKKISWNCVREKEQEAFSFSEMAPIPTIYKLYINSGLNQNERNNAYEFSTADLLKWVILCAAFCTPYGCFRNLNLRHWIFILTQNARHIPPLTLSLEYSNVRLLVNNPSLSLSHSLFFSVPIPPLLHNWINCLWFFRRAFYFYILFWRFNGTQNTIKLPKWSHCARKLVVCFFLCGLVYGRSFYTMCVYLNIFSSLPQHQVVNWTL